MRYFVLILIMGIEANLYAGAWVEKSHTDFADGWEYYYVDGDTATLWDTLKLRKWELGSIIYSPVIGGLRIIGRDWDLDDNGWVDVVLTWQYESKVDIYWNDATGFDTLNKTTLSSLYDLPEGISLVDIDTDGYEEILIGDVSSNFESRVHIFHGSSSGYSSTPNDSAFFHYPWVQHPCPIDINNDGYIDLIMGGRYRIYIYLGPGPFHTQTPSDSVCFGFEVATCLTMADVNYDTHLDIVVSFTDGNDVRIYWGPSFSSYTTLISTWNYDHSVADLNKDGYLDVYVNHNNSSNDIIYWGSASGFNTSTSIAGNGTGDCSIEDINGDGELDIAANQMGVDCGYVMWGPNYTSYTSLPSTSWYTPLVEVADFDNDKDKDVMFGGWGGPTSLYWNNSGFSPTNRFIFPDRCDDALFEDLGNLWDRSNKERYLSSVFNANDTIKVDSVRWWGNFPAGVGRELWIRGALDTNSWNQWVRLYNGGTDSSLSQIQYLQYRCIFHLDYKFTSLLSFDSIKVYYDTLLGVEIEPNVCGLDVHNYNNPFRENTVFSFSLPEDGTVNLTIYNLAGERIKSLVANKHYPQGLHTRLWDVTDDYGQKVADGIYIYILEFIGKDEANKITKKLTVLK